MYRFFVDPEDITGSRIELKKDDCPHISRSLRLKPGARIIAAVSSPGADEYIVELKKISKERVTGEIVETRQSRSEPQIKLHLAQAVPKNSNMEFVVRRCTEIGVGRIIPMLTERTVVKLSEKKAGKKIDRWQRIARAAAKQSQRGMIPEITEVSAPEKLAASFDDYQLILLPWTGENSQSLKEVLENYRQKEKNMLPRVLVLIGPEGGFTPDEVKFFSDEHSAQSVSLGPRILRTETAGLAVMTAVLYEFGELGP